MQKSNSTLIFSPQEQNLGLVDVTVRCLIAAEAWLSVAAAIVPTPQLIFAFSVIGFYMGLTAMTCFDPVYWLLKIRSAPMPVIRANEHFRHRFLNYETVKEGAAGRSQLAGQPGW